MIFTISHVATVGQPASKRDDGHLQTGPAKIPVLHFRKTLRHFDEMELMLKWGELDGVWEGKGGSVIYLQADIAGMMQFKVKIRNPTGELEPDVQELRSVAAPTTGRINRCGVP